MAVAIKATRSRRVRGGLSTRGEPARRLSAAAEKKLLHALGEVFAGKVTKVKNGESVLHALKA